MEAVARPAKIVGWGRRNGGFIHPTQGRIVKGKRGGTGPGSNSTTPGARWYQGSFGRTYVKQKWVPKVRTVNGLPIDRPELEL